MPLILTVVLCYTITSTNDKFAVSKAKIDSINFTFLMAFSTVFFMTLAIPFTDSRITMSWQTVAIILICAVIKMTEFLSISKVLLELSAFELKAWLGLTIFISYATDIKLKQTSFHFLQLLFISITVLGLFLIAKGNNGKINYKAIVIPLILFLSAKYSYGLIIKVSSDYMSSYMTIYFAMLLVGIALLFKARPLDIIKNNRKATLSVFLVRIPNVVGIIAENAVIAMSLTDYSFIQPMLLVTLFCLDIIRNKGGRKLNIIGGCVCIVGIIGFKVFQNIL